MTPDWSLRDAGLRTLAAPPALPAVLPGSGFVDPATADIVQAHLDNVLPALDSLRRQSGRVAAWGMDLAHRLLRGQRLLAAGHGGSAAEVASRLNITTWALTGAGPNPLSDACDEAVMIDALNANAQEGHLIALHAMCRAFDLEVGRRSTPDAGLQGRGRS